MLRVMMSALFLGLTSASAAGFDIQVDNFTSDRGISEAVIKVTNNTGADASWVFIDCVFMDKDQRALDIGKAIIRTIGAGAVAYDKAAVTRSDGVQFVACNVTTHR